MRKTLALLVPGALCAIVVTPFPAAAEIVALQQLTERAVRNRPALAAASARAREAGADLAAARSGYYPRLSLEAESSLGPGRELFEITTDAGEQVHVQGVRLLRDGKGAFRPSLRNELDLVLAGNLYDFGRTSAAMDAGRAGYASAQAAEEAERAALVHGVRAAYLAWLGQHALLGVAEQAASDATRRTARVQALIDEGARPKAELSVARADELLAQLELERARGQVRAGKLTLEHAIGSPLSPTAEPDPALLEADATTPAEAAEPNAAAEAALRALSLQQQAANAEARRLERADAPLLAGAITAGVRTQDLNVFPAYAVGLQFTLPLIDGGASDASADAARARAQALAAELEAERAAQLNARSRAQVDHENALAQLRTAQALLEVVTQRVSEAEEAYELGAAGLEALANARALLRRAQTELVHAKLARADARLRLRAP